MTNVQKARQTRKQERGTTKKHPPTTSYRVADWKEYNAALKRRGSITLWFSQDVIDQWYQHHQANERKRGAQTAYSDTAILLCLTLKAVYHLPYRQTEGFVASIVALLGIRLAVPDYTTMNRRARTVEVPLAAGNQQGAIHIVVDSTGLKVYGEGEWKVRQHGISKRRTWRKLHIGVDESSNLILSAAVTTNACDDASMLAGLLAQAKESCPDGIGQCSADGADDTMKCYDALKNIRATIPPRKDAKIHQHGNPKALPKHARDENIRAISAKGRKKWKQESGYHRRSKAEVAMFRYKTIFGGAMNARQHERQKREGLIKCRILNIMTHHGMPQSIKVVRKIA